MKITMIRNILLAILFSLVLCSPVSAAQDARYWEKLDSGDIQCLLCPRECVIPEGETGYCTTRKNEDGVLKSLVYAQLVSMNVDPIEKKPLFHFLPGTDILSVATAGCNLRCSFCQNWNISQVKPDEVESVNVSPMELVKIAKRRKCPSIAYTYNEPTVFAEYVFDSAALARKQGVKTAMVTCGYTNPKPLKELCSVIDAASVDLKGFSDTVYRKVAGAKLQPFLDSLKIYKENGVWLEVGYLVIPTLNDSNEELKAFADWIYKNLGPDVPMHFLRFFPQHKMTNLPPTPLETMEKAYNIARKAGMRYVYLGNVAGHNSENTYCHKCGKMIIERKGYIIQQINMKDGKCGFCGQKIPGIWK
ncbi:MAG: AmmeMemoRadiSam system radical SAM enzyme [Elusimicrobiota bacterium]